MKSDVGRYHKLARPMKLGYVM